MKQLMFEIEDIEYLMNLLKSNPPIGHTVYFVNLKEMKPNINTLRIVKESKLTSPSDNLKFKL